MTTFSSFFIDRVLCLLQEIKVLRDSQVFYNSTPFLYSILYSFILISSEEQKLLRSVNFTRKTPFSLHAD